MKERDGAFAPLLAMTEMPTERGLRESDERWPAGLVRYRVMARRPDAGQGVTRGGIARCALQRLRDRGRSGLRAGKQAQQAMDVGRAAGERSFVIVRRLGDTCEADGCDQQPRDVAA